MEIGSSPHLVYWPQSVGESKILFDVNPESFVPPPKVTSSVLLITKRESIDNPKFESF